jgi:hypothetical protein
LVDAAGEEAAVDRPVTNVEASDARNTAAPTSSSSRPNRFIGVLAIALAARQPAVPGSSVENRPGDRATFTLAAPIRRRARVRPAIAALLAV